ncbi:MAG TPA: oligopeptide/dipeptide ABC transporter ATP-binding protein [Mycobacteriales bacterium]|jgi:oligopeptide/dipeptide ABC transporter ATP-binding protein|nr:oligopeptide/dipeptide ABC transporter ATP-binding protein [Mycobacteriales bacterium]
MSARGTTPQTPPVPVETDVLVHLEDVVKHFPVRSSSLLRRNVGYVHAVDGVTLDVYRGETLGLVGESGCGKSTLARCITRLHDVTSGRIELNGTDVTNLSRRQLQPFRREMQMIFQDPFGSLNPRRRVGSIIGDPFAIHGIVSGAERKKAVQDLMSQVGLNPEHYNRFPADFSGGQRQRIGVARALALKPKLIVCDEPVSALDVSIQAQVINLLLELQREYSLTYVFIAHDLGLVQRISTRVAVMYLGQVIEVAAGEDLGSHPRHPYSAALLSASPIADPDAAAKRERLVLRGDVPSPISPPPACRFHPRCPKAEAICREQAPPLVSLPGDDEAHLVACHFPLADGERLAYRDAEPEQATA